MGGPCKVELDQTVEHIRQALGAGSAVAELGGSALLAAMLISLLFGFIAQALYEGFCGSRRTGSQVHRAFPLLAVAITGVFICVQFSLPLSLGLLGALSIVRFRTPIKEPEEIGFIMLVIMSSIACATFNFMFLGIAALAAVLGLLVQSVVMRLSRPGCQSNVLIMSVPAETYARAAEELQSVARAHLGAGRLANVTEADGAVTLTYAFATLKGIGEGELRARLRTLAPEARLTVSFGQPDAGW